MYNRYTQNPDGSFQRNRMTEPVRQAPPSKPVLPPRPAPPPPPPAIQEQRPNHAVQNQSPLSFLKQLLPGGFDMGDLAIIFLLLLMAGDKEENRSTALLTIALYFIM